MEQSPKSINALVYLLAVVALVAGYLVVSSLLSNKYQTLLNATLKDHGQVTETAIESWSTGLKRRVEAVSKSPLIKSASTALAPSENSRIALLNAPIQQQLQSHFLPIMTNMHIQEYHILSRSGITLAASETARIGLTNPLAAQPELMADILAGKAVISKLQRSDPLSVAAPPLTNKLTIFVAAPVRNQLGEITAIFALRFSPEIELFQLASFRKTSSGVSTYAFNTDGALLSNIGAPIQNTSTDEDFILREPPNRDGISEIILPVRMAIQGFAEEPYLDYINSFGQFSVGTWRVIDELGFGFVVEMEHERAHELHRFFETLTIVAFSIGLLVATVVFLIMLEVGQKVDRHRKKLMAALAATRDVNFQIDSNGTITSVNSALDKTFGMPAEEAIGQNVSKFLELGPEGNTLFSQSTLQTLSQKDSSETIRGNGIRVDGSPFPIGLQVEPMGIIENEADQYLLVVHDYSGIERRETELRAALDRAEAGQRTKTSFLSTISHELRSPLISVIAALELLALRTKSNEDRNLLESSQRSAQLLLGVIDDILDFSRIEVDSLQLTTNDISLEDVLADVTDVLRWQAWNNQVSLIPFCAPDLPRVHADGLRLRQILLNLVSNAVKFSSQLRHHGEVLVSVSGQVSKKGSLHVTLTVSDNGIGMAQETMDHIFQPFTQADSTIRRQYGGTGLGLSITDRLIRMMDGHISVSSDLGVGTTFSVEIPLDIVKQTDETEALSTALKDQKVLYVGTDLETLNVVKTYVEFAGGTLETLPQDATEDTRPQVDFVVVQGDTGSITKIMAAKFSPDPVLEITNYGSELLSSGSKNHQISLTSLLPSVFLPALISLKTGGLVVKPPSLEMLPQSKVLLVEDDQMTREITLRMLCQLGIAADAVVNGEEGLSLWRSGQYSLLLSDCHMPIMDGFQMAASIREEELERHMPKTPIIAVSADLTMEIEKLCRDCEINEYVPKPLTPAKLKVILNTYISNGKPHADA